MKWLFVALVSSLAASVPSTAKAQYGPKSAHQPYRGHSSTDAYPRLDLSHYPYNRLEDRSCHPSRAIVLAQRMTAPGMTRADRTALKKEIRLMRLTPAEGRELHKLQVIAAKYEQQLKRQAKRDAIQMRPIDRPPDPFLDQLARERAERLRKTGSADP